MTRIASRDLHPTTKQRVEALAVETGLSSNRILRVLSGAWDNATTATGDSVRNVVTAVVGHKGYAKLARAVHGDPAPVGRD